MAMPNATLAVITEPMSSGMATQPRKPNMTTVGKKFETIESKPVRMPPCAMVITIVIIAKSDKKLVNRSRFRAC